MKMALVAGLIGIVALVGCNKKSEPGGMAGNETFKIVVPSMNTDIKQGEVQTVRISIDRGDGFKQAVKLQMKAPDGSGLHVDPDDTTVQPGDKGDVQLKITADKNATLGECKILVKGTPDKGGSTEIEFKVTVSGTENGTFKVVVPYMNTDVKQGEVQTVRISIEHSTGFKQAVKLEVKAPAGLKVAPDSITVQPGDKGEVQLTITADKDAPLGECKVLVKGTPDKGGPAETEFKVTVIR